MIFAPLQSSSTVFEDQSPNAEDQSVNLPYLYIDIRTQKTIPYQALISLIGFRENASPTRGKVDAINELSGWLKKWRNQWQISILSCINSNKKKKPVRFR